MSELWYTQPAESFFQALPVGNGTIGAMIYGRPTRETITFNADTLWSGHPHDTRYPNAYSGYTEALYAMHKGDVAAAEHHLWQNCLGPLKECYQPGGTLHITLDGLPDKTEDYRRSLSLDTAETHMAFTAADISVEQTAFCSYPDSVLVIRYTASAPVSGHLSLTTPHLSRTSAREDCLLLEGNAPYYAALRNSKEPEPIRYDPLGQNSALTFVVALTAVADGKTTVTADAIRFADCRELTLYLHIATNFEAWNISPADSRIDPVANALKAVRRAAGLGFTAVHMAHREDYTALFDRVALHFDGADHTELPTDQRLKAYATQKDDVGLVTLLFDYGRYLMISASRPGSQPANLQGIWNEERQAPWSSNFTTNINFQMNDWMTDLCGLSECHLPFADFVCDLAQSGRTIAREYYHARGWCSHSNSDLWRQALPNGGDCDSPESVRYAFFYMGGAWMATHLFHHYEYTHDRRYLEQVFDTICGAAQFVSDMLVQNDKGQWQTYMSTSPENCYLLNGEPHALVETTAMDLAIADELFGQCIKACRILGCRAELAAELTEKRAHLRPIEIGKNGQILEWDKEYPEEDVHHRHVSHLYGAFPGHTLDLSDETVRSAVEHSLELRGIEGTGWSLCWKMSLWAQVGRADMVEACIDHMLRLVETTEIHYDGGGGVYANLLAAHPPFQIDANFGIVTAIIQMLLQEHNGEPVFLPALPKRFGSGSVRGLRLPGDRQVDLEWQDGVITRCAVTECSSSCAVVV